MGPARFGPKRSCMRPSSFRSSHVVNAKNTITTLITRNAFGIVIHQGSCITSLHLDDRVQVAGVVAAAMRTAPAARSRAMRARSSTDVPFEETVTVAPLRIPRALRVGSARELDLGVRALELQLGRAVDGGAGEERPVGDSRRPVVRSPVR